MKNLIFPVSLHFFLIAVGWWFIARGVCAILDTINYYAVKEE